MHGKHQGRKHQINISHFQPEAFLYTQQVKSNHCHCHTNPDLKPTLFLQENSQHRHQHNIKRRQEARLADRGILNPILLQIRSNTQADSAADSADCQYFIFLLFLFRRNRLLCFLFPPCQPDIGKQYQTAYQVSDTDKGKASHIIHSNALRHKRRTPDCCCQK